MIRILFILVLTILLISGALAHSTENGMLGFFLLYFIFTHSLV